MTYEPHKVLRKRACRKKKAPKKTGGKRKSRKKKPFKKITGTSDVNKLVLRNFRPLLTLHASRLGWTDARFTNFALKATFDRIDDLIEECECKFCLGLILSRLGYQDWKHKESFENALRDLKLSAEDIKGYKTEKRTSKTVTFDDWVPARERRNGLLAFPVEKSLLGHFEEMKGEVKERQNFLIHFLSVGKVSVAEYASCGGISENFYRLSLKKHREAFKTTAQEIYERELAAEARRNQHVPHPAPVKPSPRETSP